MTKFKIKWWDSKFGWQLSYRWDDENGGGWTTIACSFSKWILRRRAWWFMFCDNRRASLQAKTEEFEL